MPASEGPKARFVELADAVLRFVRARPLTALVGAVGAGFVVGGALSFKGGRLLLAAGTRHAAQDLLKQLL